MRKVIAKWSHERRDRTGRTLVIDQYTPAVATQWARALMLVLGLVLLIAYVPVRLTVDDAHTAKLRGQLAVLRQEVERLEGANRSKARQAKRLADELDAVEDRARQDLSMIYPNEILVRVRREPGAQP